MNLFLDNGHIASLCRGIANVGDSSMDNRIHPSKVLIIDGESSVLQAIRTDFCHSETFSDDLTCIVVQLV